MFQVPHSYSIKQSVEPSYSSSLQSNVSGNYYSNLPPPSHAKSMSNSSTLPLGASHSSTNLYGNTPTHYANIQSEGHSHYADLTSSMTPQKANVHRGNLQASPLTLNSTNMSVSPNLVPKGYNKPEQHVTYSNVQIGSRNPDGLIYSNLVHPPPESTVYSNLPHTSNLYSNGGELYVCPMVH